MDPLNVNILPQNLRPLAIQARLIALLDGLGIPHSPTWLNKPVKDFHRLGQEYLYKLQGIEPPPEEEPIKEADGTEYDFTKTL